MTPPRPLLLVDVDGVVSLFGFPPQEPPDGTWTTVDGIVHLLSATAGTHLRRLARTFELAWCSGWEEKANDYLPHALALGGPLPHLSFDRHPAGAAAPRAHWKLGAIDAFAGDRPLAWVDDALDGACDAWAAARRVPTLLVRTEPQTGLTGAHVDALERWAQATGARRSAGPRHSRG